LDSIVQRLTMLNKKFSGCISEGKDFAMAKKIFLEIKQAHQSLRAYFITKDTMNTSELSTTDKADSPINYLIKKWDEEKLSDNMKDYVAARVPILRYIYHSQ